MQNVAKPGPASNTSGAEVAFDRTFQIDMLIISRLKSHANVVQASFFDLYDNVSSYFCLFRNYKIFLVVAIFLHNIRTT
jgi:hypothetical protein